MLLSIDGVIRQYVGQLMFDQGGRVILVPESDAVPPDRHQILACVRERRVTDIMQKRCEPHQSPRVGLARVQVQMGFEYRFEPADDRIVEARGRVHDAKGMLETSVRCARINVIRESQLTNPSKPLEDGVADDVPLPIIEFDEAVDRNSD
jgi:hypothetical protein